MKNEIDVLRDVTRRFEQADIAYMLTGSIAMNFYAQPRMTRDIDIVVELHLKKIDAFIRILGSDYYVSLQAIQDSISNQSLFNLIHQESVIKVDCIIRKQGDYRKLEFERRQKVTIEDFTIFIVSKEDLILSKLLWGQDSESETQLRDVKNLLSTGYDKNYLLHWTKEMKLDKLFKKCLE